MVDSEGRIVVSFHSAAEALVATLLRPTQVCWGLAQEGELVEGDQGHDSRR